MSGAVSSVVDLVAPFDHVMLWDWSDPAASQTGSERPGGAVGCRVHRRR